MFDYLYYRIYTIYKYQWKDNSPGVYAVCILSLIQGFNILSAIFAMELFVKMDFELKKIYYGLIIAALIALNYYRYFIVTNFSELEIKWIDEPAKTKKSRGVIVLIYILMSIFLLLFLADYLSGIR